MTDHDLRKIARITGLDEIHQNKLGVHGRDPAPERASIRWLRVVSERRPVTVEDFLRANLDRLRQYLLVEQQYRCAQCGGIKALQLHHIKHRSKQRDDRIENLEMICVDDHNREHPQ